MAKKSTASLPEIRILFRYRDLVADTLEEHRQRVRESEAKACWWGWWKRPNEAARLDVWNYLEEELAKGDVWVGLFNSGATTDQDAVHRARVTAIVPPLDSDARRMPKVPEDEIDLIPAYYRRSPYSRAWLKIAEIQDQPVDFFKKYSYEVAPPLPGIPPRYVNHLVGKLVMDHDELRAMDTTIWRVRLKTAQDRAERFLAPGIRITEAVSVDPVRVNGDKLLHLTDLHFACSDHRGEHVWGYANDGTQKSNLADEVARAVKDKNVGLVVVTGDFTFMTAPEEFEEARRSVTTLLGSLALGADHLVIIPGNHDIAWTKPSKEQYDPTKEVENAPDVACQPYKQFYRELMGHEPDDALAMGRRFVFPYGGMVEVCALNSSSLEQGKNFLAGMGRVRPTVFGRVCESLGWKEDGPSLALRILAVHHHLTATEDVENAAEFAKGFGMAIDAKEVLRFAARRGVHLVLHGHRHRVFTWREGVYALPELTTNRWGLGKVSILGGGSAGSSEVEGKRNFFNLITVRSDELKAEIYRSTNGNTFERMFEVNAAFSLGGGSLKLGEWVVPQDNH